MWLWTKPCSRWQNRQFSEGTRCSSEGSRYRRRKLSGIVTTNLFFKNLNRSIFILLLFGYISSSLNMCVKGFCYLGISTTNIHCQNLIRIENKRGRSVVWMTNEENGDLSDENCDEESNEMDIFKSDGPSVIPDLSWRVAKLRLEEANTRRFLKSKPRFLPYEECRKWVQAWNRWDSEEDWRKWIDEGEKRNSYIPARPDEYYSRIGKWKGWNHFLGKEGVDNDEDFQ